MTWLGDAVIEPGRLIYKGRLGTAHRHTHAAVQVVATAGARLVLTDAEGRSSPASAAVIPAGAEHSVDAGSCDGIVVFVEATSVVGRRIVALFGGRDRSDVRDWIHLARAVTTDTAAEPVSVEADRLIGVIAGPRADSVSRELHPSVRSAVALIPLMLAGPVRLGEVADAVHLSADRLGRLFARDIGMSFPAYVRWARLVRAIEVARGGGTITDAAHAAGFADSAHLNRVFHEMFGIAPGEAHRGVRLS